MSADAVPLSHLKDVNLASGLLEIEEVIRRRGLTGAVALCSEEEVAFIYKLDASWSAIEKDVRTPLGIRIRAQPDPNDENALVRKVSGAVHTLCQLVDFGERTVIWMKQLLGFMAARGITWEHVPHNGEPIMMMGMVDNDEDRE